MNPATRTAVVRSALTRATRTFLQGIGALLTVEAVSAVLQATVTDTGLPLTVQGLLTPALAAAYAYAWRRWLDPARPASLEDRDALAGIRR